MNCAALFLVSAFAMVAQGIPSARTFGSSHHLEHGVATPHHAAHQHHAFPGTQHQTANHAQHGQVENDASVSVLVCQVVKIPVGQSGAHPAISSPNVPAAAGSQQVAASSVISSSQDALSNLRSNVRTAVDRLIDPVVTALQNASLWLNRTSQLHLQHPHHAHQHGGQAAHEHAAHGHTHHLLFNPAHVHQSPQVIPNPAVPMTIVSVPVLVPAVHAGSFPLVNLSAVVPAGLDVGSLQLSNPGQDNATSSFTAVAESITATTQHSSTPADGDLVGRTGALPTPPGTDAPETLASDMSTPTTGSDTITIWVRSGNLDNAN
ncbi:uncharacterized protein LOC119461007 isoform X2 [Dermacentor silvarum]|nr:uncharacterized protein LOC119461007 isoform X2 [Dermacentor silvarum]XP_049529228.1 uncharacterized protein LOC119461007 isoform X2 [Dermacentor silvarum]